MMPPAAPPRDDAVRPPRILLRLGASIFPALLAFTATFFLLGDIGLWCDDWFYIQRIPETGAVRSLILDRDVHFWRPLYRLIVPALSTLLWHHTSLLHLISAGAHILNAWLLHRLLLRLGVRTLAASLASLLFLLFPWQFEVPLWICCLPTALSSTAMLGLMHIARVAPRPLPVALTAFTVPFAAACLNEQPAMLLFALPAVIVAARPAPAQPRYILLTTSSAAASLALYYLIAARLFPMDIGSGHGLLPTRQWPAAALATLNGLWRSISSGHWLLRAWQTAGYASVEHPVRTFGVLILLLASAPVWAAHLARHGHRRAAPPEPRRHLGRHLALVALCAAAFPLVPIVAFNYWLVPRILYPSTIGLSFGLAALMTWMADREINEPARTRARAWTAAIAAFSFLAMAVALVGVQHAYQRRDRLDRAALERLRPILQHAAPNSVLVPVRIARPEHPKWATRFDDHFWSIFNNWWSARWAIQLTAGRSDLSAGHTDWGAPGWSDLSTDAATINGIGPIPWPRIVPFEIDQDNTVHLIPSVNFSPSRGETRTMEVPQARALAPFVPTPPRARTTR